MINNGLLATYAAKELTNISVIEMSDVLCFCSLLFSQRCVFRFLSYAFFCFYWIRIHKRHGVLELLHQRKRSVFLAASSSRVAHLPEGSCQAFRYFSHFFGFCKGADRGWVGKDDMMQILSPNEVIQHHLAKGQFAEGITLLKAQTHRKWAMPFSR